MNNGLEQAPDRDGVVKQLVRELDDDLVFALSLGSKELFHTNLLGWFAQHQRSVGDALLREWDPGTPPALVRAQREQHHLDLVLEEVTADGMPGRDRVVVENKMFALPDLSQLRRYGRVVNKNLQGTPSLVLLSLADPGWSEGKWDDGKGNVWRHFSYRSLAEVLAGVVHPQDTDYFQLATLKGWTATVNRLAQLSELACQPGSGEPVWLPPALSDQLGHQLQAPVQKLRAHHVASQLRKELGDPLPDDVSVAASLTNRLGLVEAFVRVGDNIEAGWQLQGAQWRIAIRVTEDHPLYGRSDTLGHQRAQLADQTGWMTFQGGPWEGLLSGPTTRDGTPKFGTFSPNFVYRYVKVPDISVGTAISVGLSVVHRALSEQGTSRWRNSS